MKKYILKCFADLQNNCLDLDAIPVVLLALIADGENIRRLVAISINPKTKEELITILRDYIRGLENQEYEIIYDQDKH